MNQPLAGEPCSGAPGAASRPVSRAPGAGISGAYGSELSPVP
jgi:hypothetical protein